jgi:phosphohistidine swiveling domain-containing protein
MRQTEYALMQAAPTPVARFQGRPSDERSQGEPLTGVAGSSGAGEGRVFIVRDGDELAQLPPGSVVVVPACDAGMSMILPSVRAVVSEQGGMVSHGAMLASALGVPVVVGVPNAMQRLREGERVLVDAERREVVRLEGRA